MDIVFETYYEGQLVGGLYGVAMEKIFFGESMFHHMTNASKVAFAFCIETLQENGYRMIDTQYATNHLKQFNTIEIPQQEYMKRAYTLFTMKKRFLTFKN